MDKVTGIQDKVSGIQHALEMHILAQEGRDEKVDKLYEKVVTGTNGEPSQQERIRTVEKYQEGQRRAFYFVSAIIAGDVVLRFWQLLVK